MAESLPLLPRPAGEAIAFRKGLPLSVAEFRREASALAARLPTQGHAVDLCADRSHSLVAFAAAVLRGHPVLLGGGRAGAAQFLPTAAARFPDAYVLADAPVPGCPLPVIRVDGAPPGGEAPPWPDIPAGRIAAIAFTSGSTGAPSAHLKPWGALVAAAEAAATRFGLRHGDGPLAAIAATVPAQHMYGFETTIMLPLQAQVAIEAKETFFPGDVLAALERLPGRRILVTTPLHLRALLSGDAPARSPAAVISATAPLARELAASVEVRWEAPVLEIYGASEAGSVASRRTVEEDSWLPYPGIAMEEAAALVPGLGRVKLGDALEMLSDSRFRLLGRIADIVKLGGKRASLGELNRALADVEGVEDGVFVVPDDLEQNPAARLSALVVAPGRSAEDILLGLRRRLDPAFLPRRLRLVEALPRDALGKLPRHALLALEGK
ncbi:AMP-binding protein [Sabulicella rubraurantiaca]|uniref:AMP-binding protein n=1 Tax=Sabulicella rubraurantiaca TaxID=2811429 RepID=UPI001A9583EC|nr:AMP-binding protein [Sabulicella rubraurantiaca]